MNIKKYISRFNLLTQRGRLGGIFHAFALMRENKLFSAIYIAGTAVAIASAMVIVILLNIMLADIKPEVNRSRTLYIENCFIKDSEREKGHISGTSLEIIDSCFRKMKCVEAATGIFSPYRYHGYQFKVTNEEKLRSMSAGVMICDMDFFRLYELDFLSGRPFSVQEFNHGENVCVISERLVPLQNDNGTITLNNVPIRVVGVVKPVSSMLNGASAEVYLPYTIKENVLGPIPIWTEDTPYSGFIDEVRILLRKGYSRQDFLKEVEPLRKKYEAIASSKAGEHVSWKVYVRTHFFTKLDFFGSGDNDGQGLALGAKNMMIPTLLILIFLFLPAINLSGLVSNRMERRKPEMGIRKAFGAKRSTLLREVINENLVLTLCGGMAGWLLSCLFITLLRTNTTFLRFYGMPGQEHYETCLDIDMFVTPTLFLMVFLCCVVLNLMAALIPAWRSLKNPIVESLSQKK